MLIFTIQNNLLYSDLTGLLTDPAIILSVDKNTKDVTYQKIGEYNYLKSKILPQYKPLSFIQDNILLSLNTMPIEIHQQCILLNHVTNTSLSSLTKTFVQQLFSNDVEGCRDTVNNMYAVNKLERGNCYAAPISQYGENRLD